MATFIKSNSENKIFIGLDISKTKWSVSIISGEGEPLERMNIDADFEILKKVLKK